MATKEQIGLRLSEDDGDIIQAIRPFRNKTRRIKELIRKGIMLEQGPVRSTSTQLFVSSPVASAGPVEQPATSRDRIKENIKGSF